MNLNKNLGQKVAVIVPNYNGAKFIRPCLDSIQNQSIACDIILVDNASADNSLEIIKSNYPNVQVVINTSNLGFAGGVNSGIRHAIAKHYDFIVLLNNDAVADKQWIEYLLEEITSSNSVGIVASKMIDAGQKLLDSTGEEFTSWGLCYPRGRSESVIGHYDGRTTIFAASGGASMYKAEMFKEIGIFDEDYFAYYEDVDISFRAQLAGWQIRFAPKAIVYHKIGATSGKIKGFTTYQTMKNYPFLVIKNVPTRLLPEILPRFILAYFSFYFSAVGRGQILPATKGLLVSLLFLPKKIIQRYNIQRNRKVSTNYIDSMIVHDLPPNATKLRRLRSTLNKLRFA